MLIYYYNNITITEESAAAAFRAKENWPFMYTSGCYYETT